MDTAFNKDPSIIVQEINNVAQIGEYKFDKSFTGVKGALYQLACLVVQLYFQNHLGQADGYFGEL